MKSVIINMRRNVTCQQKRALQWRITTTLKKSFPRMGTFYPTMFNRAPQSFTRSICITIKIKFKSLYRQMQKNRLTTLSIWTNYSKRATMGNRSSRLSANSNCDYSSSKSKWRVTQNKSSNIWPRTVLTIYKSNKKNIIKVNLTVMIIMMILMKMVKFIVCQSLIYLINKINKK